MKKFTKFLKILKVIYDSYTQDIVCPLCGNHIEDKIMTSNLTTDEKIKEKIFACPRCCSSFTVKPNIKLYETKLISAPHYSEVINKEYRNV